MNSFPLLSLFLALASPLLAEPAEDFLRFKNGDTLHGNYQGLDEGPLVKWLSEEAQDAISFETRNLRKLSLNNGRAENQLTSAGLVELNTGDRIPGELIAMGSDSVSLQTEFAGLLTIPRAAVTKIMPNRHGGNVLYSGPFNDEDWRTPGEAAVDDEEEKPANEELREVAKAQQWVYGSAAWYSNSSDLLRLDVELPDQASIRFKLAWQAPLNASLAVLADFQRPQNEPAARVRRVQIAPDDEEGEAAKPEEEDDEEKKVAFVDIMEVGPGGSDAENYGSGYLISVLSSYSRLQRLGFDGKQKGKKTSFPNSGGRLNLGDLYAAEFEIRVDRLAGKLTLFVNGEFYSEWQDLDEPLDEAKRYFAISAGGKSRLRISDVVIAEWNGMPDSARSMQTEERDVLLLANGVDRFSGKILTMEEEVFRVETDYGIFQIPADEVTDIQLASSTTAEIPDPVDGQILVSLQPNGLVSLLPKEGLAGNLRGEHPILGELNLDLSYAFLLEFDPIGSIFDNWDDEF